MPLFNKIFFPANSNNIIRIGSKNFTEQVVLGEILAQLIEAKTQLKVVRDFNLGTTNILQQAMQNGQIDIYPEYTGTAYLTILHKHYSNIASENLYKQVKQAYLKQFNIIWLAPFGFNNTQALAVRSDFAKKRQLTTISDLAPISRQLTIGGPTEFVQRPDGLPGLMKIYHLHFNAVKELAPSLTYEAIKNNEVDVILAFSTDGHIPAYHLQILQDNKHLFPPYDCAPLIRAVILQAHPELKTILQTLAGTINNETMQKLNYEVDLKHLSPAAVAHDFLIKKHLIN